MLGRGAIGLLLWMLATGHAPANAAVCDAVAPERAGFGGVVESADFTADGRVDLAVSGASFSGGTSRVILLLNQPGGLVPFRVLQGTGFLDVPDPRELVVGRAVASGDFNGDGFVDLAVGAPRVAGGSGEAGRVLLFRGTELGLVPERALSSAELPDSASFGAALAAADFDGDGRVDLAVGAPRALEHGIVEVFRGAADRLSSQAQSLLVGAERIDQEPLDRNDAGDCFGAVLLSADLDADGAAELLVGAPGDSADSGLVFVFGGGDANRMLAPDRRLDQRQPSLLPVAGTPFQGEPGDGFGSALALGDFDADGWLDLVVGAPGEEVQASGEAPEPDQGFVFVFAGTPSGLIAAGGFDQTLVVVPLLVSEAGLEAGGFETVGLEADELDDDELAGGLVRQLIGRLFGAGFGFGFGDGNGSGGEDAPRDEAGPGAGTGVGLAPRMLRNEAGDRFGAALAAGDFDGDGRDDLAVASPGEALDPETLAETSAPRSGWVFTFHSGQGGLEPGAAMAPQRAGLGRDEAGDAFGVALAAVDLDGDQRTELVVGAPGKAPLAAGAEAGRVFIFEGTTMGLRGWTGLESPPIALQP